jgi:hypothetical protein
LQGGTTKQSYLNGAQTIRFDAIASSFLLAMTGTHTDKLKLLPLQAAEQVNVSVLEVAVNHDDNTQTY